MVKYISVLKRLKTIKNKISTIYFYVCVCVCVQGSQDQLKEVWHEADGLDPEDFDPKTFFKMHGNYRACIYSTLTDAVFLF